MASLLDCSGSDTDSRVLAFLLTQQRSLGLPIYTTFQEWQRFDVECLSCKGPSLQIVSGLFRHQTRRHRH